MQHAGALAHTDTHTRRPARVRGRRSAQAYAWVLRHRSALSTAAIVALILASLLVAAASLLVQPVEPAPTGWSHVTVEPNASLWSLAAAHPIEGLSTSETARLIAEENGLDSGVIHPGQTVRVPSSALADTAVALR